MTLQELADDRVGIIEDVRSEVSKFGPVIDVGVHGIVISVTYAAKECAEQAREWLQGRRFAGRIVLTTYLTPEEFDQLKSDAGSSDTLMLHNETGTGAGSAVEAAATEGTEMEDITKENKKIEVTAEAAAEEEKKIADAIAQFEGSAE